jgi:hypothetical protein
LAYLKLLSVEELKLKLKQVYRLNTQARQVVGHANMGEAFIVFMAKRYLSW